MEKMPKINRYNGIFCLTPVFVELWGPYTYKVLGGGPCRGIIFGLFSHSPEDETRSQLRQVTMWLENTKERCEMFFISFPKDPGTLQWRGWNLYSRGV